MIRFVTSAALACALLAGVAHAEIGDRVLVLRAEGRVDKKVRAKVEAAVLKLASSAGAATPGDVTLSDAATMVGCKPDEDKCKDEVLGMLSVDELVAITATPKPGGIEVHVRRIEKGGVTKSATTIVTIDTAHQLDAIAPMFAHEPATTPLARTPAPSSSTSAPAITNPPSGTGDSTAAAPSSPSTVADASTTLGADPGPIDEPRDGRPSGRRRLTMFGMAGGGALVLVGIVFWASASSIEDEIAGSPMRTREDLEHIKDLEDEGDGYAAVGNVLVVSGLVVGGVSAYYFWKTGKQPARTARVVPLYGSGGTGLAITWGGSL